MERTFLIRVYLLNRWEAEQWLKAENRKRVETEGGLDDLLRINQVYFSNYKNRKIALAVA